MDSTSKILVVLGALLVIAGLLWHFTGGNIPFGKLPGDIRIEKENTKVFIPITSSILLSLVLSALLWLLRK